MGRRLAPGIATTMGSGRGTHRKSSSSEAASDRRCLFPIRSSEPWRRRWRKEFLSELLASHRATGQTASFNEVCASCALAGYARAPLRAASLYANAVGREKPWRLLRVGEDLRAVAGPLASGGGTQFGKCRAFQTAKIAYSQRRLLKDMLRHFKLRDRLTDLEASVCNNFVQRLPHYGDSRCIKFLFQFVYREHFRVLLCQRRGAPVISELDPSFSVSFLHRLLSQTEAFSRFA